MTTATATQKRMFIDGKWCDADNGRTLGVINPATEEVIVEIAYGGKAETRRALEGTRASSPATAAEAPVRGPETEVQTLPGI